MSKARNLATFGSTKSGHISGDSATFTDTVTASAFTGSISSGSTSGYYIGSDSNGLEAYLQPNGTTHTLRLKGGGKTILNYTDVADAIYLRTNDTNRLSVSSVGNIGIGTAVANSLLHVYNDVDSAEQIIIAETFGDYSRGTGISFRLDDTEMGRVNAHETRGMTFYVTDSVGNAATERMRIDTSGNVGIGTTSPSGALTVKRDININADSNLGDRIAPLVVGSDPSNSAVAAILIDGNQIEQALETDRLYLNYNSTSDLSLNNGGGNVGIGTATPQSTLHINGSITEQQYNFTGTSIDPDNGTIQYVTLTGNVTYTSALNSGEYVTLMIDDGSAYSVTWPTITWVGGSAPTLETSGYNVIELWRVAGVLYGAFVGVA